MLILSKADILGANDLESQTVDVPEWGGSVIVRAMTGAQRDAYDAALLRRNDEGKLEVDTLNMRAKLVLWTVVDEAGALLFTPDELDALAAKSAGAIERIADAAARLNGLHRDAVADAAKNSASDPAGSSSSV
ncbi:hypothetical protein PPMP20_18995 [Paraburkholderia phymatum]|uniref:Phage tail assembly chaperone n=1 Tax=Paraburkholderia phymatum (strain DSM 17167 / CIP 108236 / LMG 21445 / STM815) TaxID=391038 RepID=B2JUI1_PARP8|nr:hypothetical protein [Paraburkholderia phymatum]ACC76152.1 conserved hypothetical protein [Paraburkholderia phymatum STM815]